MPEKIQQFIEQFEHGQKNINFYKSIGKVELEIYLCNIIKNSGIPIPYRNRVLNVLIELTFYSLTFIEPIVKETEVIEDLISSIKNL